MSQQPDALIRSDSASRGVYALVVILALTHLAFAARLIVSATPDEGWDLHVTCAGLNAIRHGADPYLVSWDVFPFPYLFHVAWLSAPLCFLSPAGSMAFAWIFLVLVGDPSRRSPARSASSGAMRRCWGRSPRGCLRCPVG
jgi:hypothetical protein